MRPRLVRTIVVGYTRGELPTAWLLTFHRFEHAIQRAGWSIRVRLDPLEEPPEDGADLVLVPPPLAAAARRAFKGKPVWTTTPEEAVPTLERLLAELASGATLRAERASADEPEVVRYRGFLPL